LEKNIK